MVDESGGSVGIERYCRLTRKYSRRTAYSRLALFRKTFPQAGPDGTPEALMGPLLDRLAVELDQNDER